MIRVLLHGAVSVAAAVGLLAAARAEGGFAPSGDRWLPWFDNYAFVTCGRIDRQQLGAWTATLQRLATRLAQTPGVTGPALYAQMEGTVSACRRPYRGSLIYWPWPAANIVFKPVSGQRGRTMPTHEGETGSLTIHVNRLDWLEAPRNMNDENGAEPILGIRRVTRQIGGFPVLSERVLLVTPTGLSPYGPVTVATALKAWLAHSDARDSFRPVAASMLERLDAATLQGPAYLWDDERTGHARIVTEPGTHTRPIETVASDFYDDGRPPQAARVLAVDLLGIELDLPASDPRQRRREARHLVETADWRALSRELAH